MFVHIVKFGEEYVFPFEKIIRNDDKIVFIPKGFEGNTDNLINESSLKFNTKEDAKKVFELALCFMESNSVVFDVDLQNYYNFMKLVRSRLEAIKKG